MSSSRVISVNPAIKSLGARNIDIINRIARNVHPAVNADPIDGFKVFITHVSGINKGVGTKLSSKLFWIRALVGVMMIASAISAGIDFRYFTYSNIELAIGIMIVLGLFTRIATLVGMGFSIFFFTVETPIMHATDSSQIIETMMHSPETMNIIILMVIAILGPGRFSLDQLINFTLLKKHAQKLKTQKKKKEQKIAEMRMSYKAYMAE